MLFLQIEKLRNEHSLGLLIVYSRTCDATITRMHTYRPIYRSCNISKFLIRSHSQRSLSFTLIYANQTDESFVDGFRIYERWPTEVHLEYTAENKGNNIL